MQAVNPPRGFNDEHRDDEFLEPLRNMPNHAASKVGKVRTTIAQPFTLIWL